MALLAVLAATAGVALIGVSPAGAATLNVTLGGTDDGCADSTFTTISSAITCAANGDTITVGPGTFNEQVIIDKDVSIVGSGVGVTVIDGLGATNLPTQGQVRIATSGDVTISNLTVANPGANSASAGHYGIFARGVGVATATGTWTISQVRIDGGGLTPFGLGVYCFGNADNAADLVLQDSTIENNRGNLVLMENCTGSFTATGNTFTQSLVTDSLIFAMRYDGAVNGAGETQLVSGNTFTGSASGGGATGVSYNGAGPVPASGTTVGRFSGVTIADNTFTGLATGITLSNNNSPGVVSTTGLIDDATISGNRITGSGGAAITTRGIRLRGSVLGTTISGNTISTMGTGILIQGSAGSNPVLTVVDFNRIVGNTVGMDGGPAVFVDGDLNWWGCNTGPNTAGCDTTLGAVDADPWLVLGFSPLPASPVQVGGTTTFAVTTVRTSSGGVPAAGVPHNPTVTYGSAVLGTVAPPSAPLAGGVGPTITYTALGPGGNAVTATLDNATITAPITNVQQQQSPATRACSAATPAAGFTDVAAGDAHTGAIDCLVALGIANGKSTTTYDPTGAVTRGQMASFIARSFEWAGVVLPVGPDAFDDDDGDVHEAAINQLAAAGIVHGTGGRSFQPGAPLSRAQAATFVVRTFERISGTTLPAPPSSFTDTAGNVHATNIDKAAAAGIVLGTTPTTFGPDGTTTRAQMASLIVRMLDKLVAGGFAP